MKKLYVLTRNNGDGSASVCATFDTKLVKEMRDKYENDDPALDFEAWVDGDGFHYQTWTVPDECTAKSMGFSELTRQDVFH